MYPDIRPNIFTRTYADGLLVGLKPDLQPRLVGRVLTRQSSESGVLRKSYLQYFALSGGNQCRTFI